VSSVETTITNRIEDVTRVSVLLDDVARAHGLPPRAVADMQVALDEVLTNIITHGYADDAAHEIRVRLTVGPDVLQAQVEDDARPFDPLAVPAPDLGAPLMERRVGGLGIHFVRKLMSEVTYALVDNRNRLVLKRHLTRDPGGDDRGPA
jgi:anti-sigma regulatory factor (Ser/Thr protein kinase)